MYIEILTAPGCANCSEAKRRILAAVDRMRSELVNVEISEVDVTEHPETAIKYGIMSTPAIAIDGRLLFRGVPKERDLLKKLRRAA